MTTDKAGHQANAAVGLEVHLGHVGCIDQLVVHEDPGALGLGCLVGKFFLGHLDKGVPRCIGYFNFKHLFS